MMKYARLQSVHFEFAESTQSDIMKLWKSVSATASKTILYIEST